MTQVEIPQLSLGRYVELLKRRRWQLVPVSLLGLLIGGLVAFFIPRYFVAETLVVHSALPGTDTAGEEKPLVGIVDTAKSAIPTAVGATLDALAWPEAMALEGFARDQYERAIEKRVFVDDSNPGDRKRTYAKIKVTYLDRDGQRAADFCNKLVEVWIEQRLRDLRLPAKEREQRAIKEADRWRALLDDYLAEKRELERSYGIKPNVDPLLQRQEHVTDQIERRKLTEDRRKLAATLEGLEASIVVQRQKLADTPERVAPDSQQAQQQAVRSAEGKVLLVRMLQVQASIPTFKPGSAPWLSKQRELEALQVLLQNLTAQVASAPDGMVPNPEYAALQAKLEQAELQVVEQRVGLELLDRELEERRLRDEALATGWSLYETKLRNLKEAEAMRDAAVAEQRAATKAVADLYVDVPVRVERPAQPPPAPTEPNILLVALIGCILGLGAAIGLILLLDFLQGTFKTVDDVERGLSLPVLGGIAHLETVEERRLAVRGRRRVSLIAVTLLVLIGTVIVIYHVDPTSLPAAVRDVLQLLLGP